MARIARAVPYVRHAPWAPHTHNVTGRGQLQPLTYLQHRVASSRAKIIDLPASPLFLDHSLERGDVTSGQVHDVNVVAHARAIDRIKVVAKYREERPTTNGDLIKRIAKKNR